MRMFLLLFLLEMLQKYKLLPRVIILTLLLKLAKPLSRFSSCCISPLQIPIYWAKPSIPYSPMKEHPQYSEILPFSCVRAYTLRRDSKGAMPLGTQTLEQSLVCYTLPEVYTLSRYARTQRFARSAPYIAVSPSESPLHFADRRAESVIVGYYTSAEVLPRKLPHPAQSEIRR